MIPSRSFDRRIQKQPDISFAVACAVPLWGAGMALLIGLAAIAGLGMHVGLKLTTLTLLTAVLATAAVFRVMARDLREASERNRFASRRLALRRMARAPQPAKNWAARRRALLAAGAPARLLLCARGRMRAPVWRRLPNRRHP